MKKILLPFLLLLTLVSFTTGGDCNILHNGTFTYNDDNGQPIVVIIEGDKHTEYHQDNKYSIESNIKWVNDCEFNATLVKATLPNFPFKRGTVMNIKVDKIEGDNIYCIGKVEGKSFKSKLTKVTQKK